MSTRSEIEDYLFEFLEKAQKELTEGLEKMKDKSKTTHKMPKNPNEKDGDKHHEEKGINTDMATHEIKKADLYNKLMKDGQTQSALMLKNWDQMDDVAKSYNDKMKSKSKTE